MKTIIEMTYNILRMAQEDEIMKAVQECGINVDKERLMQALSDAKAFYDEGYADGRRESVKWIPVTERLPEYNKRVFVTDIRDGYMSVTVLIKGGECRDDGWEGEDGYMLPVEEITHWMPLPEPPKEGEL